MASLKPETLYKPLTGHIEGWRKSGYSDDEINDHILDTLGRARQAGYTDEEMTAVRSYPENPLKEFARRVVSGGLTLGYYVPDWLKQTPQETSVEGPWGVGPGLAGDVAGLAVPFGAGLKGASLVGKGVRVFAGDKFGARTAATRIGSEALRQGVAGGAVGGLHAESEGERLYHAGVGAAAGAGLGAAGKAVGEIAGPVLARRAAARAARAGEAPLEGEIVDFGAPEPRALPPGPQPRGAFPLPPKKRVFEAGEEGTVPRPAPGEPPAMPRGVRPYEEAPGEVAGRRGVPDEDLLIRRPVGEQPRPLQTASERAQRRAGLDPTEPSAKPGRLVSASGQPILYDRAGKPLVNDLDLVDVAALRRVAGDVQAETLALRAPVPPPTLAKPMKVVPEPGPARYRVTATYGTKKWTTERASEVEAELWQDSIRQAVEPSEASRITFVTEVLPGRPAAPTLIRPTRSPAAPPSTSPSTRPATVPSVIGEPVPSVAELLDTKGLRFRVDRSVPATPYVTVGEGGEIKRFAKIADAVHYADALSDTARASSVSRVIRGQGTKADAVEMAKLRAPRRVANRPMSVRTDVAPDPIVDPPPMPPTQTLGGPGAQLATPEWLQGVVRVKQLAPKDAERFALAVTQHVADDPALSAELRAAFEAPKGRFVSWSPLDWIGQPSEVQSPIIRKAVREAVNVEMRHTFDRKQWAEYGTKHFGHLSVAEREQGARVVEGELAEGRVPQRVRDAVGSWRLAAADFAKRLGVPEWSEYLTRLTNYQGVYEQWRPTITGAAKFEDLSAVMQEQLGSPGRFATMKKAFERRELFADLPRDVQDDVRARLMQLRPGTAHASLPASVRDRIPKEIFDRFLLPRTGGLPYQRDLLASFDAYVPIALKKLNMDPWLERWEPIATNLTGGKSNPVSEGAYLRKYIQQFTGNDSAGLNGVADDAVRALETLVGKKLADPQIASRLATRGAAWGYRGLMGLDSAIVNATQAVNTWAQGGTSGFLRGLGQYLAAPALRHRPDVGLLRGFQELEGFQTDLPAGLATRFTKLDDKITKWVLSPMSVAEHVNRGVAFLTAMEQAAARGRPLSEALQAGFARQWTVVPNLTMTKAQNEAIFEVAKTQFGYSPALRNPYFAGPLARLTTQFWSYPTRQAQFVANGMGRGLHDLYTEPSMEAASRLTRYTALLGATAGLSTVVADAIGVDISRALSLKNLIPTRPGPLISLTFEGLGHLYNSLIGDQPMRSHEWDRMWNNAKNLAIPQHRYVWGPTGVLAGVESAQRGYTVNRLGDMMYRTTPVGELARALGFPAGQAFEERRLDRAAKREDVYRKDAKSEAVAAALDGDLTKLEEYNALYPAEPIRQGDLRDAATRRQVPLIYRSGTKAMRLRAREALEEEAPSARP